MKLCTVTGYLYDGSGTAMPDILVTAFPVNAPIFNASTGQVISRSLLETVTDSNGLFTLKLIQGVDYCINIKDIGYKEVFAVPDEDAIVLFPDASNILQADTDDIIPIGATSTGNIIPTTNAVATSNSTTIVDTNVYTSQVAASAANNPDSW